MVFGGREDVVLLGGKGKYCKTRIGVVEVGENGIVVVVWDVVWIKG